MGAPGGSGDREAASKRGDMQENPERIPVLVEETYDEIARRVARCIADLVRSRHGAGKTTVLGLATGSTPIGIYRELIRLHRERASTSRRS